LLRIEHNSDPNYKNTNITTVQEAIEATVSNYYTKTTIVDRKAYEGLFDSTYEVKAIGGLVGNMASGQLISSYSKVDVSNANASYAGGIIGYVGISGALINQVYAFGNVVAGTAAGGIVGYAAGNISFDVVASANYYKKDISNTITKGLVGKVSVNRKLTFNHTYYSLGVPSSASAISVSLLPYDSSTIVSGSTPTGINLISYFFSGDYLKLNEVFNITSSESEETVWNDYDWTRYIDQSTDSVFPFFNYGIESNVYIIDSTETAAIFRTLQIIQQKHLL
jgi:hypothetical protein